MPPKEGFSEGRAGAIALIVRDLAAASPPGWQTTVLGAASDSPPYPGLRFLPVRPGPLLRLLGSNAAYAAAALRALRRDRPDVVEVHNRPDVALRLARGLPGVPVVLVLHNDPRGMRRARTPDERRALLGRLGAVCCVSGHILDRLTGDLAAGGTGAPPGRALVMHNGLRLDTLPPPSAERGKVLLFVGRLAADKGADTFVRACALALPDMPGWRAAVIGADRFRADSPETPFTAALRPLAASAGIDMLGFRNNAETLAALSRAAVAAVPSRWHDPYPRVAQEALACGAVLVTTRRGGLPELAGDAAVYVDHEDPASLAAAFRRLAGDPALRAALSARGRARAAGFELGAVVGRWTSLRESLLG
nr:glycosyltransferase family 4 protein [Roseomonas acroporae]